jgi:hypothetical protein
MSGAPRLETELMDQYVNNLKAGNVQGMVSSLQQMEKSAGWQYWSKQAGVNDQLWGTAHQLRDQYNQDSATDSGREALQATGQMLRSIPWE